MKQEISKNDKISILTDLDKKGNQLYEKIKPIEHKGDRFEIPGEGNVAVPVRVNVPETAKIGDVYNVKVLFTQLNEAGGAGGKGTTIGLVFNQRSGFEIAVIAKESTSATEAGKTTTGMNTWIWVIGAIAVILIAWLIIAKVKKKNSN